MNEQTADRIVQAVYTELAEELVQQGLDPTPERMAALLRLRVEREKRKMEQWLEEQDGNED